MAHPKSSGPVSMGAMLRWGLGAALALGVQAQDDVFACDCETINAQVMFNSADPSAPPSGVENVLDPTCIVPCRLVELGIPMGPFDLVDIQRGCTLVSFRWFDVALADQCESPARVLSGPSCAEGYDCGFGMQLCNMNKWPQYCIPSEDCAITLLRGKTCPVKTNYHAPRVCPASSYCPRRLRFSTPKSRPIPCPSDNYCPYGSAEPIECGFLSLCGEGQAAPKQYGLLAIVVLIDAVLALIWCGLAGRNYALHRKMIRSAGENLPVAAALEDKKDRVKTPARHREKPSFRANFRAGVGRAMLRLFPSRQEALVFPPDEALQRQTQVQQRHTRGASLFHSAHFRGESGGSATPGGLSGFRSITAGSPASDQRHVARMRAMARRTRSFRGAEDLEDPAAGEGLGSSSRWAKSSSLRFSLKPGWKASWKAMSLRRGALVFNVGDGARDFRSNARRAAGEEGTRSASPAKRRAGAEVLSSSPSRKTRFFGPAESSRLGHGRHASGASEPTKDGDAHRTLVGAPSADVDERIADGRPHCRRERSHESLWVDTDLANASTANASAVAPRGAMRLDARVRERSLSEATEVQGGIPAEETKTPSAACGHDIEQPAPSTRRGMVAAGIYGHRTRNLSNPESLTSSARAPSPVGSFCGSEWTDPSVGYSVLSPSHRSTRSWDSNPMRRAQRGEDLVAEAAWQEESSPRERSSSRATTNDTIVPEEFDPAETTIAGHGAEERKDAGAQDSQRLRSPSLGLHLPGELPPPLCAIPPRKQHGIHVRDTSSVQFAADVVGKHVKRKKHRRGVSSPMVRASLLRDIFVPTVLDAGKEEDAYHVALQKLNLGFVRARASVFSLDFEFENLSMSLPSGKQILTSVSGRIEPAKVTAVMGPSGAGKTTFMNVLMSKVSSSFKRSGELRINGAKLSTAVFKKAIGYVPQEDVMHRALSVRDNIGYSAHVRAPRYWSRNDIQGHVDAVLHVLNLHHVQHSIIGDEEKRGVSGGQRKRVNIGMELAACPVALFLDEPTSGLDSAAALSVIQALKDISKVTGITVAMVVHQPRREIWDALDQLLLLAPGGRTVYQGPQDGVENWFRESLSLAPTIYENPADYYMDAVGKEGERCVKAWADLNNFEPLSLREGADEGKKAAKVALRRLSTRASVTGMRILAADAAQGIAHTTISVTGALGEMMRRPRDSDDAERNTGDKGPFAGDGVQRLPSRRDPKSLRQRLGSWTNFDLDLEALPEAEEIRNSFPTFIGLNVSEDLRRLTATRPIGHGDVVNVLRKYGAAGNVHQQAKFMVALHAKPGSEVLSASDVEPMCREMTRRRDGAGWLSQVLLAHRRALRLWIASPRAIAAELATVTVAGVIIGFATGTSFTGVLRFPYTLLSPASEDFVLPLAGMLIIVGSGISSAPAGVSVFGAEKVIYWRETSVGHSRSAYFLGVSLAATYRIVLSGCHFAAAFAAISNADLMSIQDTVILTLLSFFCMHGLSNVLSMLLSFESAMLVSVVLSLLIPIMGGLIAIIPLEVQRASFGRAINEAVFSLGTVNYRHLFVVEEFSDFYAFTLDQVTRDQIVALLHGVAYRIIAYLAMIGLNRDHQR